MVLQKDDNQRPQHQGLGVWECLHTTVHSTPHSPSLPCCCFHSSQLAVRCKVEALSFSAHADYEQTSGFLDTLQPPHVVLVHGERGEMMKLRAVSGCSGLHTSSCGGWHLHFMWFTLHALH